MGRVVHFEIHADDPERAVGFYTGVFGWTVNRFGDQPYAARRIVGEKTAQMPLLNLTAMTLKRTPLRTFGQRRRLSGARGLAHVRTF